MTEDTRPRPATAEELERQQYGDQRPPLGHDPNASKGGVFVLNKPTVIVLLYLAAFVTVFSCFIGVILAYVWRNEPHEDWEDTHYIYLIRTFWFSLLYPFACLFLLLFSFGIGKALGEATNIPVFELLGGVLGFGFGLLFFGAFFLAVVRSVLSLVKAQNQEAMPKPRSWLT